MAALILMVLASFLTAAAFWFVAGSRLRLSPDQPLNEILNLAAYFAIVLPVSFAIVFFVW
jgi:heme/copper-type cytochrome/quinol oxidase subunit 4